jgi:nucleoside phosphorylase
MELTFPELLRKLPKGKRTGRNQVLIAMAVLGATEQEKAVESTAIIQQLKLNLGRAAVPKNVADVLRKATPYAACVSAGKRDLKWYLTGTALSTLEAMLGIELTKVSSASSYDYDLAIVCALHEPEFTAVQEAFGGSVAWRPGPAAGQAHIYQVTEAKVPTGAKIRVVAGVTTYMGLTATAILATQMLFLFRPRMIVTIGIAAGTKSSGRAFGDVLIADPSVDYASGKVSYVDGAEAFHPDPYPLPIDARLRTLIQEDKRTRDGLDEIASTWVGTKPQTPINIHIGPLGAADQVVDSEKRLAEVTRNWRKLIGVEMETYAVYRAVHEAPQPRPLCLGFKAVCDFAAGKSDTWQEYAAYVAARYAQRFLVKNWAGLGLLPQAATS